MTWSVKVPAIASSSSEDDRLPLPADLQGETKQHVSARHLQLHSAWVQVGILSYGPCTNALSVCHTLDPEEQTALSRRSHHSLVLP